jgi:hypothetical protein
VPLVVVYLITGAYWQLAEARQAAGEQPRQARTFYRRAFAGFGRLPTPYLFGSAFADYIGYPHQGGPNDLSSGPRRDAALAQMLHAAQRHPDGPWADHALYEYIRLGGVAAPESDAADDAKRIALQYCRTFLEQYPTSLFAPDIASRMVRLGLVSGNLDATMWAYERALKVYRGTEGASEAAAAMQAHYMGLGDVARATEAAIASADVAPATAKPEALLRLGGFLAQHGRRDEAREAYGQVGAAVAAALEASGLASIDVANAGPSDLIARTAIVKLRSQARDALAALDATPEGTPAPAPH